MNYLVVDSSFIMADLFPDEKKIDLAIYNIYVPAIFYLECTNVLWGALKKNRITLGDFQEYQQVLGCLPFTLDKFSATPESIYTIGRICQQFDLTSYDASYFELALRLEAKLGTGGKKLIAASKAYNISIVSIE